MLWFFALLSFLAMIGAAMGNQRTLTFVLFVLWLLLFGLATLRTFLRWAGRQWRHHEK